MCYDVTAVLSQPSQSFVLQKNKYFPRDLIDSELHMCYIRLFQHFRCLEIDTFITVYVETRDRMVATRRFWSTTVTSSL